MWQSDREHVGPFLPPGDRPVLKMQVGRLNCLAGLRQGTMQVLHSSCALAPCFAACPPLPQLDDGQVCTVRYMEVSGTLPASLLPSETVPGTSLLSRVSPAGRTSMFCVDELLTLLKRRGGSQLGKRVSYRGTHLISPAVPHLDHAMWGAVSFYSPPPSPHPVS